MSRPMLRVIALASFLLLAGCHRQASAPGDAPGNFTVEPGDGQVTVSWDQQPGLTYWIFFQQGTTVTAASPAAPLIFDAQSPRVIGGLANGTQYAFVMNATNNDSRGGPSTPVAVAAPRPAGAIWTSGAPLGTQDLNGVFFSSILNKVVAVGNAGTIFEGDYNYSSTDPNSLGVTAWTPATIPSGYVSDLSSVMLAGSVFVALGTDGSTLTSTDGVTWTLGAPVRSGGAAGPRMNSIGFGLVPPSFVPKYVAVGDGGSIFTSTDLGTWVPAAASNTTSDLYSVSFPKDTFIATGAGGTLLTSTDADTWTPQVSNTTNALRGATYGTGSAGAYYAVVGDSGTIVTSIDATTWSVITPAPLSQDLRAVRFGTRFVAVGQGGIVAYSDDAIGWATTSSGSASDLASLVFTGAMYFAVGASGANAVSR